MRKRIIALASSAAMIFGMTSGAVTAQESFSMQYSPRAEIEISDGLVEGITDSVTADWLCGQLECSAFVTDRHGNRVSGDALVPSGSILTAGDTEAKVVIPGDSNRDGKISLSDASVILKTIAQWQTDCCILSADADKSGSVNLLDVSKLLKYLAKWDVTLGRRAVFSVSFDEYVLLAGDPETDEKIVASVKSALGIDVTVADEITDGMKYITVGRELWNEYGFMDSLRCRSLFPENSYMDTYGGNLYLTACGDAGIDGCVEYLASAETLVIPKGYTGTVGSLTGESRRLYNEAVQRIEKAGLRGGTANEMSDDIYTALVNAEYTEPENVILMIGDGMGKSSTAGAEIMYSSELHNGKLAMNHLPVSGSSRTYSALDQFTDSAAGATALAAGYKTSEGTVAMNSDHSGNYKTILEIAAEAGKSTGVVATKSVVDATPAAFTAHVEDRYMWSEIAMSQLDYLADGTLDIVLGGGYSIYERDDVAANLANAKQSGVTYTRYWDTAQKASLPLAGLFAGEALSTNPDSVPSLSQMTNLALERLSEDDDGFFLMVEGSQIDTFAHNNMFGDEIGEVYEFDCAVSVALRYAALNPDTVVIVTADHETGALFVNPDSTADELAGTSYYSAGRHTWVNVPVHAVGYGTGALGESVENTDIAIFMAEIFGETIGARSNTYSLFSDPENVRELAELNSHIASLQNGAVDVRFTPDARYFTIPASLLNLSGNVRAINVTYTSCNEVSYVTPVLKFDVSGEEITVQEWWTYVSPGESYTETYVIPAELIGEGMLSEIGEMVLRGSNKRACHYVITDITVINDFLSRLKP